MTSTNWVRSLALNRGSIANPRLGEESMTGALVGLALIGVVAIVLSGLRALGPAGPGDADSEITPFAVLAGPLPDRLAPTLRRQETLVVDHDMVEADDPMLLPPEGAVMRRLDYLVADRGTPISVPMTGSRLRSTTSSKRSPDAEAGPRVGPARSAVRGFDDDSLGDSHPGCAHDIGARLERPVGVRT